MAKNEIKIAANVVDTVRPALAGADRHPGWHALRSIAGRITTPLLPDDYLKLANPLWSARELRGRVLEVRRETVDSATLVIKPGWGFSFDYEPGQYVGIGVLMDGRWRWRSYSLTSSPVPEPPGGDIQAGVRGPSPSPSRRCPRASCPATWSAALRRAPSCGWPPRRATSSCRIRRRRRCCSSRRGRASRPVMSMLRTLARRNQIARSCRPRALGANGIRRDVRRGAGGVGRRARRATGCGCAPRGPRAASTCPGSTTRCRTGAIVRPGRAVRRACSTTAEKTWSAAGIAERLHLERFARRGSRCTAPGGTVTFERSGKTVDGGRGDVADGCGRAASGSGCRSAAGWASASRVWWSLVDGHVRDLRTGVEHEPGSRIQTCISAASGDCVLDV